MIALFALAITLYFITRPKPNADPFTSSNSGGVVFPLYYPTTLPSGFHVALKSVNSPQSGVYVVNYVGPDKSIIYMSQEARPSEFNIGGFDSKLSNVQTQITNLGEIEVGQINNGVDVVGSLATNKSWIIINTSSSSISLQEVVNMLASLRSSH